MFQGEGVGVWKVREYQGVELGREGGEGWWCRGREGDSGEGRENVFEGGFAFDVHGLCCYGEGRKESFEERYDLQMEWKRESYLDILAAWLDVRGWLYDTFQQPICIYRHDQASLVHRRLN